MATYDYDLGVIGAGAAGLTAAAGAAKLGARTLLVESRPELGGDCLHFGCVPSKTLIASANARHLMANPAPFGLPEADLPPVDFGRVAARIRRVIARIQVHDSPERFRGLGVDVAFGRARFTDDHQVEIDGKAVSAARWIVAAGSAPAVPEVEGLHEAGFLTNETLFALEELPQSLVVLGGGAMAVEMAQAFARLGSRVTVIQRSSQLLSGEDADMAGLVLERLRAEGVDVRLGAAVLRAERDGPGARVVFAADGQEEAVEASRVLVAMGRRPNLEGLGLEDAGVAFTPAGIGVDGRLRTSRKHIFAAGDVTGRHLFTHAAGYEAGLAMVNAVLGLRLTADYRLMPRAVYCDPELAGMGLTEKAAKAAGLDYDVQEKDFAVSDRALTEGRGHGKIKLLLDGRGRVLGVRIAGPRAGELLALWPQVLAGKLSLKALARTVLPYPTLAELSKGVAADYVSPRLLGGFGVKALRLLRGLRGPRTG